MSKKKKRKKKIQKKINCKDCGRECNSRGSNTKYCIECKHKPAKQSIKCEECGKLVTRSRLAKYCYDCSDYLRREKIRRRYYLKKGYTEDQIPPKGWKKEEAARKKKEKEKARHEQKGMPSRPIERSLKWERMAWDKKVKEGKVKVSEPSKEYIESIQKLLDLCDEDCCEDTDW